MLNGSLVTLLTARYKLFNIYAREDFPCARYLTHGLLLLVIGFVIGLNKTDINGLKISRFLPEFPILTQIRRFSSKFQIILIEV